ncbi:MAG: hypothetical protein QME06_10595 [Desulfobacterales bacterium]|nr:hypothetical protein [Desulfobacterales bacterium]
MSVYQPGDYIKVEFQCEQTGESEWMWVRVKDSDDEKQIVFGCLDSEPIVNTDLWLGMDLAISFDNIREHFKESSFNQ